MQQVRLLRQPVAAAAAAALGAAASAGTESAAAAAAPAAEAAEGQLGRAEGQEALLIGPDCDRSTFRPSPPPPPPPPVRPPPLLVLPPRVPTLSPPPSPPDAPPRAPGVAFVARDTSQEGGVPMALVALGGGVLALAAAFLCLPVCCPNASIEFNRRLRGLRQPAAAVPAEAKAD